ncbi:hypothetical protein PoB_005707500 [Plakobranchus ocellatus]|uniref:Uncharacterized protein n=1 Tax=Plakobranchus ocellatus TaxID=259542 RepID=A0AAV4CGD1_9GAST|nr:hypothetical protein PoB_005707500 [Plakobranchus ocellatus]
MMRFELRVKGKFLVVKKRDTSRGLTRSESMARQPLTSRWIRLVVIPHHVTVSLHSESELLHKNSIAFHNTRRQYHWRYIFWTLLSKVIHFIFYN